MKQAATKSEKVMYALYRAPQAPTQRRGWLTSGSMMPIVTPCSRREFFRLFACAREQKSAA